MIVINELIASEFNLKQWQVDNALELWNEGATLPFIARYRKEKTGTLDETQLRDIFERNDYLKELAERKITVLETIESQGKLDDALRKKIENCISKTELEDIYLPYKPKKRTKATIAKEKGLEPLALEIKAANDALTKIDLNEIAAKYINKELEVNNEKEALAGAADIIAEEISEIADLRNWVRNYIFNEGYFVSKIKAEFPEGTTKYESYRDYQAQIKSIQAHNMLAMRRGEDEKILTLDVKYEQEPILNYLEMKIVKSNQIDLVAFYQTLIKDCFSRLMKNSIIGDVRLERKQNADLESVRIFENNAKQMLLSSPAGMKPTLGIDPGFRTGCKAAVIDSTGKFIEYATIFPHNSANERLNAKKTIIDLIKRNNIELVAIGNGTAGRETDQFVTELFTELETKPIKVMVNEAGASIYSASEVAKNEFPDLDLTIRGAISIARRLQDPLAELVKIDPKSIGVGQYQHDVDQKLLKKRLEETVASCVNFVGVDLNTASKELLMHVSGITSTIANGIVTFRNAKGAFKERKDLLKVPRFGDKTFEQAAGFLRIKSGTNLLDNTAVHPEAYEVVESILKDLNIPASDITKSKDKLAKVELKKYVNEKFGEPTLKDILAELEKPGLDPREEFKYAQFSETIKEIKDLKIGMELEGVVTNITAFGAFVDIGVHQDGLIHISEISNQFIRDASKLLKVGQIVNVLVIDLNVNLKRINLSMKQLEKKGVINKSKTPKEETFSMDDLKNKFSKN